MHPDLEPNQLSTAAVFYSLHEADLAKGLLDSCGIDCFLYDEHMHRVHPVTADITGGIRLQVPTEELEVAKELLKEFKPMDEPHSPDPIE